MNASWSRDPPRRGRFCSSREERVGGSIRELEQDPISADCAGRLRGNSPYLQVITLEYRMFCLMGRLERCRPQGDLEVANETLERCGQRGEIRRHVDGPERARPLRKPAQL